MAIDWTQKVFPLNVTEVIVERFKLIDESVQVVNRGIRKMDPHLTIGLYPESWQPVPNSKEIQGLGIVSISSLNEYYIQIHTLTKGSDQPTVQDIHAKLSKIIRDVLEFDIPLKEALSSIPPVTVGVTTESFKSFETLTQAYFPLDNASSTFVNIGALRCKITTETRIG